MAPLSSAKATLAVQFEIRWWTVPTLVRVTPLFQRTTALDVSSNIITVQPLPTQSEPLMLVSLRAQPPTFPRSSPSVDPSRKDFIRHPPACAVALALAILAVCATPCPSCAPACPPICVHYPPPASSDVGGGVRGKILSKICTFEPKWLAPSTQPVNTTTRKLLTDKPKDAHTARDKCIHV